MNRTLFRALLGSAPFLLSGAARAATSPTPTPSAAATSVLISPSAVPVFKPAPLFSPYQLSMRTLPNGVRGIVKSASGSDLVNIQVWVRAGSSYENDRESGAAHVLEILALRGSQDYPAASDGDENGGALGAIRALGGDGGSLTSRDSTFYSATVAAPYAARALRILADATLRPDLSSNAVEAAKEQASDDIARRAFDPVSGASDLAYTTVFAKHPYRRAAYGSDSSVSALSAAVLRAYHARRYAGSNLSVVIVGQIAAGDAQKLIAQNFGKAPKAGVNAAPTRSVEPLKRDVVARRRPVSREVIDLGWRSPGISNPDDCVAMDTLLALWSEGLDANLRRLLLRDGESGPQTPLVASYDVDFLTQRDAGLFLISLVDPQDREGAVDVVLGELKRVRENGLSQAELERAKTKLRSQYLEQSETVAGQAGALGFYDVIGSHRFAVEYLDRVARVTGADVQRVAKKYLAPDAYVRAEVLPLPRPRPQDEDNGPIITARYDAHRDAGVTR